MGIWISGKEVPYGLSFMLILGMILIEFNWFSSSLGSNLGGVSIFLLSSFTGIGLSKDFLEY